MLGTLVLCGRQVREHVGQQPGWYPGLAAQRAPDHGQQVLNGLVLDHPSRYADPHRVDDPALIPAGGDDHDPHIRVVGLRFAGQFDTIAAVEVDIDQDDVEALVAQHRAGLLDRRGGRRGQPRLDVQPTGQSLRERDVVVHDEEVPDWRLRESQRCQRGRVPHHRAAHPLAAACLTGGPSEYSPVIPTRQKRATMLVASNRECAPSLTRTL